VWAACCPTIRQGIEALEEQNLVGSLGILEVPPMVLVGLNATYFDYAAWEMDGHDDQVVIVDRLGVENAKGVLIDRLDGSPCLNKPSNVIREGVPHMHTRTKQTYVDDLKALFEELRRVVWEKCLDALLDSRPGLIKVNASDRPADSGVLLVCRFLSEGMVED